MSRKSIRRIHLVAASGALIVLTSFLSATLAVELFGTDDAIRTVKHWIARGLVLMVIALAATGSSGYVMSRHARAAVVRRKLRRTQAVGAIGVTLLVPCALYLDWLAAHDRIGPLFAIVQGVEIVGGFVNLSLLLLNFRDGMRLRRPRPRVATTGGARVRAAA